MDFFNHRNVSVNCDMCKAEGKIEIGKNYLNFKKPYYIPCPACEGKKMLSMPRERYDEINKRRGLDGNKT